MYGQIIDAETTFSFQGKHFNQGFNTDMGAIASVSENVCILIEIAGRRPCLSFFLILLWLVAQCWGGLEQYTIWLSVCMNYC